MFDPTLFGALLTMVVLGGALVRAVRSERRRVKLASRLSTIARTTSSADAPVVLLRRSGPQRKALPMVVSARLEFALAATGNLIRPGHLAGTGIVAAAAFGLGSAAMGLSPALAITFVGATAAGAPMLLLRFAQSRYQRRFLDGFPDALDLIVRAVRSGLPAPEAIELVAREVRPPVGLEFQRLMDEVRIGNEMTQALQHAADRIRVADFRFFAVSLLLQRQTGGGIAETLASLSGIIRQRKAVRAKARALAAEARASAAIVATTPFIAGGGLFLINRDLVSVLVTDPRGRFMLGIAVACLLTGIASMHVMIKKNLR